VSSVPLWFTLLRVPSLRATRADQSLAEGCAWLAKADRDFDRVLREHGLPPHRFRPSGFATLLRAIVAQQVSTASALAIWGRLCTKLPRPTAEGFLALTDADLRAIGFSRQKVEYGRLLADAVASKRLDLAGLRRMPDDEALAALVAMKGIGRWTAEIYLMFALDRADIFPADDLALTVAAQKLKRLDARPNGKALRALAEPWQPWRTVAAQLLWHYYRHMPA
jgi:DNA-3-methyladenine glycosylase II